MATLSEAYRDNPLLLHHIIPLDFRSARSVPESHVWSPSDGFSSGEFSGEWFSLPVVDLTDRDAPELMGRACRSWGAFQLTGHGISGRFMEEVEAEARRLFGLPTEQKLKALRSPGGATGYGAARISPFFQKYMWHEGFTIMGSAEDHARELWPHGYQSFCEIMETYQKQMKSLAEQLLRIMFKSLNIPDDHQQKQLNWLINTTNSSAPPCTALQLNSYPSCPDPNRAMGLAPHTDTSLLTILHQTQSDVGLQIRKDLLGGGGGTKPDPDPNLASSATVWVPVRPVPGALVVNVGDLLHIMSNGRFPCVVHRAVVNQTRQRLSFAYFYSPPTDFTVAPVAAELPLYRSVTVKEYIGIKAKNLEKALSLIRI